MRSQMSSSQVEGVHQLVTRWQELEQRTRGELADEEARQRLQLQTFVQQADEEISTLEQQLAVVAQGALQQQQRQLRQELLQLIRQDTEDQAAAFDRWKNVAEGALQNLDEMSVFALSLDIRKQLGSVIALCTFGRACATCLTAIVADSNVSQTGASLGNDIRQLAEEMGTALLTILPHLTAADVWADAALSPQQVRWGKLEVHVALRLLALGMPATLVFERSILAYTPRCSVEGYDIDLRAQLLLFPFGLDPSDAQLDRPQQESSICMARRVAASAEAASLSPVNLAELLQQSPLYFVALARLPETSAAKVKSRKKQHQLSFCVQLVHEWRLHSAAVRTQLVDSLSSPLNDAACEVQLIADYLDLESAESKKQQQQSQLADGSSNTDNSSDAQSSSAAAASSSSSMDVS